MVKITNKFNMTREQNVFLAKRNAVDFIWKSAKLEGLAITFPATKMIAEGLCPQGVLIDEAIAVNNLKKSWQFVLEALDTPLNLGYVSYINKIVCAGLSYEVGKLRSGPVSIEGTTWKPPIPIESQVIEELENLNKISNPTDKAITTMLWAMKRQLFWDGNKRGALFLANKIMIENGAGIIAIPVENLEEFFRKTIRFYETDKISELKKFVYDKCIDGIDFQPTLDSASDIKGAQAAKKTRIFRRPTGTL